ncbi:hypothetical protein HZC34_04320 [Candidatus Saganbacteria bacterium]|nr:hypothetical protein [Candidatus Saganbacteria bacterium]
MAEAIEIASNPKPRFKAVKHAPKPKQKNDGNLYMFFGVNHLVPQQHEFFKELAEEGRKDTTTGPRSDFIALESFWAGGPESPSPKDLDAKIKSRSDEALSHCQFDQTKPVENYIKTGDPDTYWYLHKCINNFPPVKLYGIDKMIMDILDTARNSQTDDNPSQTYRFFPADLSPVTQIEYAGIFPNIISMEARESFSAEYLRAKLAGKPSPNSPPFKTKQAYKEYLKANARQTHALNSLPKDEIALRALFESARKSGNVIFGLAGIQAYLAKQVEEFKSSNTGKAGYIMWGSSHVEKFGSPKYVSKNDRSLSIILNGGRYDPDLSFDKVIRDMGLEDQMFAWILPSGTRDADVIIHLPINGSDPINAEPPPSFLEPKGAITYLR